MQAMIFRSSDKPLELCTIDKPVPDSEQVLVKVSACGVCRTDLHIRDAELAEPKVPLVLGHEIVGTVEALGAHVQELALGDRVCVPWLGGTCLNCYYCCSNQENLCDNPQFTGYTTNGGFAEYTLANWRYCFKAPSNYDDLSLAPLICAGLIGWRSYKFADHGESLGIYGFGAAAHIITQVAIQQGKRIFAFTRAGDLEAQKFALSLGAEWAGDSDSVPPQQLDAAIIFAPVGSLVPKALRASRKGAVIVCGGIYMSDIPSFSYDDLWHERTIKSVANLTREDAIEFFRVADQLKIKTSTVEYSLDKAEEALNDLRAGNFSGAAVIKPRR